MRVNIVRRFYWLIRGLILTVLGVFVRKRSQPNVQEVRRILIIVLSRIGDVVYTTPVYREIKKHMPQVTIDILCRPYTADVFKNNPHTGNIILLSKKITGILRELGNLKKKKYHIAIDLTADDKISGSFITRLLSGAQFCIGYDVQKRGLCFDRPVPYPEGKLHATKIYLHLLEQIGIPVTSNKPEIVINDSEREEINKMLKSYCIDKNEVIIGLHPGASFSSQRLTEKKWAAFCDIIQNKFHKKVVLFGGPRDYSVIENIRKNCQTTLVIIETLKSLRDAIIFIGRCDMLLCNNSGPLHIAEALGTPTLSWMGPTIPHRWYPLGDNHKVIRKEVDCAPCNRGTCSHHSCAELITLEEMEQEFELLLCEINK